MRSIPLKAVLAGLIDTVPLPGALAAPAQGGDRDWGRDRGDHSSNYSDFSQNGWFDGINSFKAHPAEGKNFLQQLKGE